VGHRGRCITAAPHAAHPGILVTGERAPTAVAKLSLCHKVSRKKGGSHGETLARAREAGGKKNREGTAMGKGETEGAESARTFKFIVMLGRSVRGYRSLPLVTAIINITSVIVIFV